MFQQQTFWINGAGFLQAGCPSHHNTNSLIATKKTIARYGVTVFIDISD